MLFIYNILLFIENNVIYWVYVKNMSRGENMFKLKKMSALLLIGALLLVVPTSASAANVYGVVSNKWHTSSTINDAVMIDETTILATNSSDIAVLSTDMGGQTVSNSKNKPSFPSHGMVKTPDDNIFIAGSLGKWKVVNSYGEQYSEGQLADKRTPTFVKTLSNDTILLVYPKGYYTILDGYNPQSTIRTGKWPNSWDINDTIELDSKNLLMVGDQGKYQVLSPENGNVLSFDDWGSTKHDIFSIDKLSDGRILAVGEGSKYGLFDKTGKEIDNAELTDQDNKSYTWKKVIALKDNHALVIGSTGQMLLVHVDASNKISVKAKTKIDGYSSNGTVIKVNPNQIFITLSSGKYMVYQADL